jgi:hypothetical protein
LSGGTRLGGVFCDFYGVAFVVQDFEQEVSDT